MGTSKTGCTKNVRVLQPMSMLPDRGKDLERPRYLGRDAFVPETVVPGRGETPNHILSPTLEVEGLLFKSAKRFRIPFA